MGCKFTDCLTACIITFIITIIVMIVIHIMLYFRFVVIAKKRYGEKFVGNIIISN
jgi:hypothetical protein